MYQLILLLCCIISLNAMEVPEPSSKPELHKGYSYHEVSTFMKRARGGTNNDGEISRFVSVLKKYEMDLTQVELAGVENAISALQTNGNIRKRVTRYKDGDYELASINLKTKDVKYVCVKEPYEKIIEQLEKYNKNVVIY